MRNVLRHTLLMHLLALLPALSLAGDTLPDRSYQSQQAWQKIQQYLPPGYRFTASTQPVESRWDWKGHHVHIDRFANPQAVAKIILLHGVGTNGRQMSLIAGGPLSKLGYEVIAPDMPGYGLTTVAPGVTVRYDDWVALVDDLIKAEMAKDNRPVFLYGLSAGGMLAWHAAARNGQVKGIVGMTFLDQRRPEVRDETARNLFMSRVGGPMTHWVANSFIGKMPFPMTLASKMSTLVNNPDALAVFLDDPTSAGNKVPLRFLDTYMNYQPVVEPESFTVCPVLLTQPEKDRWTPLALSEPFLNRLTKVPHEVVMLQNAGHYPLEQLGLDQMVIAIDRFVKGIMARTVSTASK